MGATTAGKFSCDGCGKSYTWKSELAGRRVKCKCGGVMTVPVTDPAAAVEPDLPEGFEDLYALAEGPAVTQAVTPPEFKRAAPVAAVEDGGGRRGGGARAAAGSGGGGGGGGSTKPSPMLGYAQMAPKRHGGAAAARGGEVFFHPVKDLYIPGAAVVAGTVMSYLALVFHHNVRPGVALFAVGVMTLINLILTVPAILATVKIFDLGLGPIGPGVLKIAACAILPGAIGELMGMIFSGSVGGYIGWVISYLATLGIFMKLLDMDFGEVLMCSSFIFVIRTWVVYALLFALLHGIGISGLPMGGGFGGGGGGGRYTLAGEVDHDEDDSLDAIRARESDEDSIRHLHGGGVDARAWLEENGARTLSGQSRGVSTKVVGNLFAAGATEVRAFTAKDARNNEVIHSMIVVPPDDKGARGRVVDELKRLAKSMGRVKFRDRGERYFPVELLTPDEKEKLLEAEMEAHFKSLPKGKTAPGKDDEEEE